MNTRIFFWSLTGSIGRFLFGFDTVVISGAEKTIRSGYRECQEFFGAITSDSSEPLGNRIVTMLDVALHGIGDRWNDVVLPGFDLCVVENTLGKYGARVENLTKLPIHTQNLVGGSHR